MWFVQKVGVDERGEIDRVQWQAANTTTNSWIGQPLIVPVIAVVDAALMGKVGSVVPSEEGGGRTVQGPYIRTFARAGGSEGIEADPSGGEQRSLYDLPRLLAGQISPG